MNMKMNSSIRKLVAGSLVCAMAAGATPFTNVNPYAFTKVQAATEVSEDETELSLEKEIDGNIWWGWEGSMWVYKDYGTKVKVVSTSEEIGEVTCTFESSDSSVFTVDKDGYIAPVSMGEATLTVHATTKDGKKQTKTQVVRIVDHFECGEMAYAPIGENEIKFLSAFYEAPNKDQGRICIPYMINSDVMKVVGAESCAGFKNVKFIEVPKSVTTIEDRAFADNDSLEFVMIPKSVTKIADTAFDRENTLNGERIIIKGYKGTEAENFAKAHEDIVTFEAIEGDYVPYKLLYSIEFEGCSSYREFEVGEEYQLVVKADPIDTDEEITLTSEDESVVSVTSAGAVTAKKPGYTKIIATSTTGIEKILYVYVNAPLETAEPTATPVVTTTPTAKVTETPVVTPTAKVTETPVVTPTAEVTETPVVTATAEVTTAPAVTATAEVTTAPVTTPGLDWATPTPSVIPVTTPDVTASADVSESDRPTDTASPAASEEETTSDIVDVINSILNTPLTDDKKEVSQTSNKTSKAKKASLSILTSKNKKFVAGKKYTLKAQKKNTSKKLKWSVSNKKIATINENTGVLKAKKAGKVTITVTCGDLKKKITIKIQ